MSDVPHITPTQNREVTHLDAVIIGAGFSGLYALHRLRQLGLSLRVFDEAAEVGGSWWWNRYPGARVDFLGGPLYCYTFSEELVQGWDWEETHPDQKAVLGYLNYAADVLDLRRDIQLDTRVTSAVFDENLKRWQLATSDGKQFSAQFLIGAMGVLSSPYKPLFEGIADFKGELHHTGHWPQDAPVDFSGKHVGVIGTGSSGVQIIPEIAKQADHVTVFQRTPQFVLPARNQPMDPEFVEEFRRDWPAVRQEMIDSWSGAPKAVAWGATEAAATATPEHRREVYEKYWQRGGGGILLSSFNDILVDPEANESLGDFVRDKIRETVDDPAVAERLLPSYHIGTKRLILGTDYYETYNRDNVTLVDLREQPIEAITEAGVRTSDADYDVDVLVLATGYDAITGALVGLNPIGRGGVDIRHKWSDGVGTYLGMAVSGFPNLFMMQGPGSPSTLYNMPLGAERQGDWIAECISFMRASGLETIDATAEAEEAWGEGVRKIADRTLYPKTDSWYSGANIPGKPRQFMVHLNPLRYYDALAKTAANGYSGFTLE
jgi:cation diffusion facilitator CzcD-associated flavoprotein CzcO